MKRALIFWMFIAIAIIARFEVIEAHAAPVAQVCQHDRCLPETDPKVLQCVVKSCEQMADGVYRCEPEVCVARAPEVAGYNIPRWAFNYSFAALHYVAPDSDAPFPEHNGDPRGLGVEYHFSEDSYVAVNRFRNSFYRDSVALTVGNVLASSGYLRFGVEAGFANGYSIAGDALKAPKVTDDIVFVAGLVVRVGGPFAVKAIITPDFTAVQAQYLTGGDYEI